MRYAVGFATAWLVLAAVAGVPQAAAVQADRDPQEVSLNAAIATMQAGKSAQALAMIEPVLAAYETQYADEKRRIYCGFGPVETLLYMGMAASAKKDAVAIQPNWCSALYIKAFALIDQKQLDAGLVVLNRVVEMAPYHAHYLNELGYVYQTMRRWPEALAAYDRAAGAASMGSKSEQPIEQTRAWRGRGFVLVEQGKWVEAETMYRQCLKLDPNDAKAKAELQYIAETRPKPAS